jgi:hypothetical protein
LWLVVYQRSGGSQASAIKGLADRCDNRRKGNPGLLEGYFFLGQRVSALGSFFA